MNRKHVMAGAAAACALALALHSGAPLAAAAAVDAAQVEKRFAAVAILIEKSSATRQIDASGDARALERRGQARAIYREAQAAYRGGDPARAAALLNDASARMLEAVRHAAPEQVTGPKQATDFEARLESVRALAAAHQRIVAEKPNTPGAADTARTIEKLVGDAQALAAGKNFDGARTTLDQAYLVAKAAVSSLRGGDTLVRTLSFANAEEEYRYEVDRNDTHEMLVKVLLKEKPLNTDQRANVERAQGLRVRADAAAKSGDHGGAVRLLEDSTRELVRTIRSAGIFIPG